MKTLCRQGIIITAIRQVFSANSSTADKTSDLAAPFEFPGAMDLNKHATITARIVKMALHTIVALYNKKIYKDN